MADSIKPAKQVNQRSPFAGCILMIAVACSFLFILVFSFFSLLKQDSAIKEFTNNTSSPVPVSNPEARANDLAALDERLSNFFKTIIEDGKEAEIRLTADDLNLAIGGHHEFNELQETFYVDSFKDGKMIVSINEALNGAPLSGTNYYLTGQLIGIPVISDEEVVFDVQEIKVPGKDVPDGFLGNYSPRRLMQRYKDHEKIGPMMRAIKEVKIEGDTMVVKGGVAAPETNDGVGAGLGKLFGMVGIFTVILLSLVFVALKFGKSSK